MFLVLRRPNLGDITPQIGFGDWLAVIEILSTGNRCIHRCPHTFVAHLPITTIHRQDINQNAIVFDTFNNCAFQVGMFG